MDDRHFPRVSGGEDELSRDGRGMRGKLVLRNENRGNADGFSCAGGACNARNAIKGAEDCIERVNDLFNRYGYSLEGGQPGNASIRDTDRVSGGDEGAASGMAVAISPPGALARSGKDRRKSELRLERRPVIDDYGTVSGVLETESDSAGHKSPVVALRLAKQAAEAANLAKSEFLARMCHEIRNPVNVMIGMMDLALQTNLTPEQREYLALMKTSSDSLLSVIDDSLDLARIEAGCLEAENIPFSLRESLGEATKMLAFEARKKGLVLAYDIGPDVPDALQGDPMRLRQIVVNLLGNAIKFTGQGDVVMRVECQGIDDDQVTCRFAIADSGPGIPKERQAAIFAPFLQADASTARRYGGSGLGLAISAHLVKMLGGMIWLESAPDKGSTFVFTVRFRLQNGQPAQNAALDCQGLRVLVVEDHPVSRRFLANTLRQWNADVDQAESGKSALALIERARAAQAPYRLVLLDDALHDVDCHAVIEQLQGAAGLPATRIVLLGSSPRHRDDGSRGEAEGLTCLTMPLKQSELLPIVASAVGLAAEKHPQPVFGPVSGNAASNFSVLVVDDNAVNCRVSQLLLEKAGYRVLLAGSAADALKILACERLDLVLMDVQMPEMNGAEVTALIRRRERIGADHLPIVGLSANVMPGERERCLQAGMDEYLIKPINPERLLGIIERLKSAPAEWPEAARHVDQVLDRHVLLLSVSGDRRLLAEIIALFLDNCSTLMTRSREAMGLCDQDGFARALHTLLGMFQSLSACAAQEIVGKLQTLSIAREPDRVEAIYAQLDREVNALKAALIGLNSEMLTRQTAGKSRPRRFTAGENDAVPGFKQSTSG